MSRAVMLLMLCAQFAPLTAHAADVTIGRSAGPRLHHARPAAQPFPLSRRARDIRLADTCWHDCQVDAGVVLQTCLATFPPTVCTPSNDAADRFCLRTCRISGGPWVNWAE